MTYNISEIATSKGKAYKIVETVGIHNGKKLTMTHQGLYGSKQSAQQEAKRLKL